MLHWICVHASGLMTSPSPLSLALDMVPCNDHTNDLHRALHFLEDVEEAVAHLEEILTHILRAVSFKSNYLLTRCLKFH
jgi:hypothetical protein